MRNLMWVRYQIGITFCLISIMNSGCVTSYQKVDDALLEQNRSKTFNVGIVKAAGDSSFGNGLADSIEYRKKALNNIPIEEICSILNRTYSLNIDANVNKTAKVVKEDKTAIEDILAPRNGDSFSQPLEDNQSDGHELRLHGSSVRENARNVAVEVAAEATGEILHKWAKDLATAYLLKAAIQNAYINAYYGNLEYDEIGTFCIKNNDKFPDVVNVTYSLNFGPPIASTYEVSLYYDVDIISSGQEIITLHGTVGSIKADVEDAKHNQAAIWNWYVDSAGRISEALKRDLFKTAKRDD